MTKTLRFGQDGIVDVAGAFNAFNQVRLLLCHNAIRSTEVFVFNGQKPTQLNKCKGRFNGEFHQSLVAWFGDDSEGNGVVYLFELIRILHP